MFSLAFLKMSSHVDTSTDAENDDPTLVLKVFQEYKQSRRQSLLMTRKRPISGGPGTSSSMAKGLFGMPPKRPNFDDTTEESKDPMEGKR